MKIDRLRVLQFRNHHDTVVAAAGAPLVLLEGPNGAGKTSLLEAVHLLATGVGLKTRRDSEFVRFGADGYRVEIRFADGRDLALRYREEEGRTAFADGTELPRWTDLVGRMRLVSLDPSDLDLVAGGPAERRRFLDIMLSQDDRRYFDALRRYRRALRQVGSLPVGRARVAGSFHRILEEEMPAIFAARAAAVERLGRHLSALLGEAGLPGMLRLEYRPAAPKEAPSPDWRAVAALCVSEGRKLEAAGIPNPFGPVRDEVLIVRDGVSLRRFGSQGQKRVACLLLRLAEHRFLSEGGAEALILVDDVLGELDRSVVTALLGLLKAGRGQVWIAGTDISTYEELWPNRAFFGIRSGSLQGAETL